MCTTCGCSDSAHATITDLRSAKAVAIEKDGREYAHGHEHAHTHGHCDAHVDGHGHTHDHGHTDTHGHTHDQVHTEDHGYFRAHGYPHSHSHSHSHDHSHDHDHIRHNDPAHALMHDRELSRFHDHQTPVLPAHSQSKTIALEAQILAKNDTLAARNRGWFEGRNILALNLVSSPGAGKTSLLERTIYDLGKELTINVVEGDQATLLDAQRIKATGCKVVQINTGTGCHLEADMLARGLKVLQPPLNSIVMIENVGNLVCPALFDLGEQHKVAILSVTEGEDKPIKYPHMFAASQVMILNKIDLLPYVKFDLERCCEYAREVNPDIQIFSLSATTGEGIDAWYSWLRKERRRSLDKLDG